MFPSIGSGVAGLVQTRLVASGVRTAVATVESLLTRLNMAVTHFVDPGSETAIGTDGPLPSPCSITRAWACSVGRPEMIGKKSGRFSCDSFTSIIGPAGPGVPTSVESYAGSELQNVAGVPGAAMEKFVPPWSW